MADIKTVKTLLDEFYTQMQRWKNEEISDADMSLLCKRIQRKLDVACYCDTGQCCILHQKHVTPHQGCILR